VTRRSEDRITPHLPLKPVDFLVLMVLAGGERHGYALTQDIAAETGGTVRLVPGNLYTVLRRLLDAGLIRESKRRPAPDLDDARRRYYGTTPTGRAVLTAEAGRLRDLVAACEARDILSDSQS